MKKSLVVFAVVFMSISAFASSSEFQVISENLDKMHNQLKYDSANGSTPELQVRLDYLDLTYLMTKAAEKDLNSAERRLLEGIILRNRL